jgi:DNA invertase Pin-like site-specific DNA recombinase
MCRLNRAVLILGKLDRLSRDAVFLLTLVRETGDDGVVFCDMPNLPEGPAGKFMVGQLALVAELEAGMISQRTKSALAAAKARGQVLGCKNDNIRVYAEQGAAASAAVRRHKATEKAVDVLPLIEAIKRDGTTTLRGIADALNKLEISAPRGDKWSSVAVMRVLNKAEKTGYTHHSQFSVNTFRR